MYIKLWIGNLGKYNEGYLVGDWFELPIDDIEQALESIGVSNEPDENGVYYEEYHICDYETDVDGLQVDRYDSLTRLNDLAYTLNKIENNNDEDCFQAILESETNFEKAINIYESGRFSYIGDIEPEEYGREMLECILDRNTIEIIESYFDFQAYGESFLYDYTETSHGYIYFT